MTPRFTDAMNLRPADSGFEAELGEDWTIGPKIHGGVMVALCAKAAREAFGGQERWDSGNGPDAAEDFHPVAVSANFLSAPDPGPVRLHTVVRKRGRRIGLVDVELVQGDRACVHAVVTLGIPEHLAAPLYCDDRVVREMDPRPPAEVQSIGPGIPLPRSTT